jgi:AcrR family transcriptional regulator
MAKKQTSKRQEADAGLQLDSVDSRKRILDATIDEILENGVLGLRLASVAGRVGVTTPLIYKYFEDREDLIAEALGDRIERDYLDDIRLMSELFLPRRDGESTAERAYAKVPKPQDPWRVERRWLRLEAKAASRRLPALRKRLATVLETIEEAVAQLVEDGRRLSGNTSTVPARTLAWMFVSFSDGFTNVDLNEKWVTDADYRLLVLDLLERHVY